MHSTQVESFSTLRNFLWPIHKHEHKKLIPMLALFFLISFIYNVLRAMKVTLVVTQEGSGAEVIPFLKVWAVLPSAVLLMYLYTQLFNRLKREQVFYTMLSLFLGFFALFLFVLYPNREALELTTLSDFLQQVLPKGLKGLIAVIRHWHLSLFYVLSELWGAAILSMLFWGFANEVTKVGEAKRFYAIFALGANFSGIFSGQFGQLLSFRENGLNDAQGCQQAWDQSVSLQLSVVLILGVMIFFLFRWVTKTIERQNAETVVSHAVADEPKQKFTLLECFSYLLKSRYMLYIAIVVVAYNFVYNMADVLWTRQVNQRYPNPSDFNAYMNAVASLTGVVATFSGLVLSGNVIRRYGWTVTAMLTPLIFLVTSVGLFSCILLKNNIFFSDLVYTLFQMPVINLILMFGSAQMCFGRGAKYTVFDETKEIAFIPLPKEEQRKGKAVVDGIASRLGKSGGSVVIQMLLLVFSDLALTIPYIAGIFLLVISVWIFAVRRLGVLVKNSIDKDIDVPASDPVAKGIAV